MKASPHQEWFADWPDLEVLKEERPGAREICVAVLDGPVDLSHPALAGCALTVDTAGGGAGSQQARAADHGTAVAGIIFGIAPGCTGLALPVFEDEPSGAGIVCSQLELARGVIQAAEAGAQIINVSGGEHSPSGSAHPLLADAVRFAAARGALIVAAAGNDGCDCLHVPGALSSVLAVGAMDASGQPLASSNWGASYRANGILALGAAVTAAVPGGGYEPRTGTSYACALVSGVVALLLSAQRRHGWAVDPIAVKAALLRTAAPCAVRSGESRRCLAGRLNVRSALEEIRSGGARSVVNTSEADVLAEGKGIAASGAGGADVAPAEKGGVTASDCGCGCGGKRADAQGGGDRGGCARCQKGGSVSTGRPAEVGRLVYALGTLGYDFGSEARGDSIRQQMGGAAQASGAATEPERLLAYLDENPYDAEAVQWTLSLDATPIYMIRPGGAFAATGYERLREFLREQIAGAIERISVPGAIIGNGRLASGQVLPVLWPALRGMYSWSTSALVDAVTGSQQDGAEADWGALPSFLERVYHGLRNLGLSSQDRAINYAATNALNAARAFEAAAKDGMQLDEIEAERSPFCRPESDCWDVKLIFFDPERQLQRARTVYRFTVDVSDVCPVMVGDVRSWSVR